MRDRILFLMVFSMIISHSVLAVKIDSSQKKRRVTSVKVACIQCRKKHQGCDNYRPCTRCVNANIEDQCIDAPRGKEKKTLQKNNQRGQKNYNFSTSLINDVNNDNGNLVVSSGLIFPDESNEVVPSIILDTTEFDSNIFKGPEVKSKQLKKKKKKLTQISFQNGSRVEKKYSREDIVLFPRTNGYVLRSFMTKSDQEMMPNDEQEIDPLDDAFAPENLEENKDTAFPIDS